MAIKKHTVEERKDFHDRLNSIYDTIPPTYIETIVIAYPDISANRIYNVRQGRTIDFEILEKLEELAHQVKEKLTK